MRINLINYNFSLRVILIDIIGIENVPMGSGVEIMRKWVAPMVLPIQY